MQAEPGSGRARRPHRVYWRHAWREERDQSRDTVHEAPNADRAVRCGDSMTTERARCFDAIREHIWPSVVAGDIRPVIDQTYPLSAVLDAHEHMRLGTHFGKLMLDCQVQ